MILNTKYYGHYFVFFKKNASSTSALIEKKREQQKFWNFFFGFIIYYSLSLSPSCQSPSSRATICDIYISIFLKAKKVGFIVLVPFEHLQSELLSKFTLTEMGEKNHTHTNCYSVIALLRRRIIKQITFFSWSSAKKKKKDQSAIKLVFCFDFFPENSRPPFLVPVHPLLKKN